MFQTTLALILFLFPLAYSPGPGNLFFAANGARFGFRATLSANAGYHLATWVVTVALGLGFIAALDQFPQLFRFLHIAGSLYVLWLAWKLFRAGALTGATAPKAAGFLDGVVLLILNPKAYVIIALMFTQFLGGAGKDHWAVIILISTVFTLNNAVAFSLWTLAGDRFGLWFRSPQAARKLNMVFGTVLAGVAIWMLLG